MHIRRLLEKDAGKIRYKMAPKKQNKKLIEEIQIPEGINASIEGNVLIMKKDDKELRRVLNISIKTKIEDNKIILNPVKTTKREKKLFGTMKAHVRNMIKGLEKGFTYKLQISNVHFPMSVSQDKETGNIIVKNFLGEKKDRIIKLVDNVEVKIDKEIIEINSYDIEKAGQAATNIEKGTRVRNKDRRIFQDGIFIIEKPGRKYL